MIVVLVVAGLLGCNKAIYFEAEDGNISVPGGSVHGKKVKYHSVPCMLTDCSTVNHPSGTRAETGPPSP